MGIQFGIFDHLERRRDVALDQQYEERLALLARADEHGFYAYHLAEHHQSALCMAPSQNVFLAAAARHTRRLKLGTAVMILPFHHPLRLIEEICMLDQLSSGRLQVGVGRGITAIEHNWWGHPPEEAQGRFEETLECLRLGLGGDTLSFRGKYFQFDEVAIELRPKQTPYPPFWYAGSPELAAQHGMHYLIGGGIERTAARVVEYNALREAASGAPNRVNGHIAAPLVGSSRHVFVADTDAEAERIARRAFRVYAGNFAKRGWAGPGPETRPDGTVVPLPGKGPGMGGDLDLAMKVEAALVGSPATVRAYVQAYAAQTGANYFVGAFQWGDLTHAEAMRSLDLFAAEVMPAVSPA